MKNESGMVSMELLTVVQAKKASWNAFCKHRVNVIFSGKGKQIISRYINNTFKNSTIKRTKWIRKRISCGRPNQNRSSRGWTTGTPFTTWPLSWIVNPIWVMITWSFVPTNRIICIIYKKQKLNEQWNKTIAWK